MRNELSTYGQFSRELGGLPTYEERQIEIVGEILLDVGQNPEIVSYCLNRSAPLAIWRSSIQFVLVRMESSSPKVVEILWYGWQH